MQSEYIETRLESDVVVKPARGTRRVAWPLVAIVLLIRIGQQTACRYCCNAQMLVFDNGEAACGCEHSQAMRGLAAWLIIEEGDSYSDEKIVAELNRWRATYFPKQTLGETLLRMKQAGEPGIAEIEAEFPEFMPDMVGSC